MLSKNPDQQHDDGQGAEQVDEDDGHASRGGSKMQRLGNGAAFGALSARDAFGALHDGNGLGIESDGA